MDREYLVCLVFHLRFHFQVTHDKWLSCQAWGLTGSWPASCAAAAVSVSEECKSRWRSVSVQNEGIKRWSKEEEAKRQWGSKGKGADDKVENLRWRRGWKEARQRDYQRMREGEREREKGWHFGIKVELRVGRSCWRVKGKALPRTHRGLFVPLWVILERAQL